MAGTGKHGGESPGGRRQIAMIAIAWFVRMRSADRTPEDERRFRAWLEEDASHGSAYAQIEEVWDTARDAEALPGLQVMRQRALRPRTGFLRRAGLRDRFAALSLPAGLTVRRVAAAAVTVAVLTSAGFGLAPLVLPNDGGVREYETAAGQRQEFTLPDGSRVTLSSGSHLRARYCSRVRRVQLTRGEAYFSVAHDSKRPFLVGAGDGTVKALGTEFDVDKRGGEVTVVLVKGSVEVAALRTPATGSRLHRLEPNERISYDDRGLSAAQEVDAQRAVSWHTGRITVVDEPLLDVIDKMNRHSGRKLMVDRSDPKLRGLQVTGQFTTGRPETLIQYIRAAGIKVWPPLTDSRGNVILRLRHHVSKS